MSAQHTTALNITLVNSLMPVTTLVLAIPLLQQRITLKNSIGVLLAFLGALTVILQGNMAQLWTLGINQGDGIMTIAMICWSVYTLLLRKWNIPIPGFDLFAIMLGIGLTLLTPFYLWELRATGGFLWNREIVAVIVYVALFPSLLAYLFWNYGVTETSPSTAALFAYLTPLITALLTVPLLNETPHFYHVMGGTAILAGLWLSYDIGQTNAISLQKDASG
jgi:drug/metabolite transporter (DMT)-like permease